MSRRERSRAKGHRGERSGNECGAGHSRSFLLSFQSAVNSRDFGTVRQLRREVFDATACVFVKGSYVPDAEGSDRVQLLPSAVPAARLDGTVVRHDYAGVTFPALAEQRPFARTDVSVVNRDCLEEVSRLRQQGLRPAVLNMASAKQPGGGYLGGAGAQEENLFRRTNLWLFLDPPRDLVPPAARNYPLPLIGGLYCPSVTVIRGSEADGYPLLRSPELVDVVTVAALSHPQLVGEGPRRNMRLSPEGEETTLGKMRAIYRMALEHGNDCLVLSALGCGAYGNPPQHVAELFEIVTREFAGMFSRVSFAIIDDHNAGKAHNPDGNYTPFAERLDGMTLSWRPSS